MRDDLQKDVDDCGLHRTKWKESGQLRWMYILLDHALSVDLLIKSQFQQEQLDRAANISKT